VSSVKSGRPGGQPSASSYLQLDTPNSRQVAGGTSCTNKANSRTSFRFEVSSVKQDRRVKCAEQSRFLDCGPGSQSGVTTSRIQDRPAAGRPSSLPLLACAGWLYKQTQLPEAGHRGSVGRGSRREPQHSNIPPFHCSSPTPAVQTNPISAQQDVPPFHYSMIPPFQPEAGCTNKPNCPEPREETSAWQEKSYGESDMGGTSAKQSQLAVAGNR